MNERPLVITHGNCIDGFCAVWVMAQALGEETIFFHALYGAPPPAPEILAGRDVYMVDFSYPRPVIRGIAEVAASLTIFDHHKTAADELIGLEEELHAEGLEGVRIVFDLERSGAGIAWDEMHPDDKTRPWLVDYVEDRDLWRFKLGASEAVNAYIGTIPHELEAWTKLDRLRLDQAVPRGEGVVSYLNEYSRVVLTDSRRVSFQGHLALIVNAHYKSCSELLNYALKHHPDVEVAISWYRRGDGLYQYSLRSREGGPKVNALAKIYDGGGHDRSAGFVAQGELDFGREDAKD